MTDIKKSIELPFSVTQIYDLVLDLGKYPEFLSWCKGVEIQSQTAYKINAIVHASKLGMDFSFSILYQMEPSKLIKIYLLNKGPFTSIEAFWHFKSLHSTKMELSFELKYELSNAFLGWTLNPIIKNEINNTLKEFGERATGLLRP